MHITLRHFTSRHVMSHHVMSHHITSCHVTSRHVTSQHVSIRYLTSRHVATRHVREMRLVDLVIWGLYIGSDLVFWRLCIGSDWIRNSGPRDFPSFNVKGSTGRATARPNPPGSIRDALASTPPVPGLLPGGHHDGWEGNVHQSSR